MPLPMTVPTTIAAAWLVVRRRASSGRDTTGSKTAQTKRLAALASRMCGQCQKVCKNVSLGVKG